MQESYTNEWLNLIDGRSPQEIASALNMLKAYFACLDDLNSDKK